MTIDNVKTTTPTAVPITLTPGRYRLDRELTTVRFSVRKLGVFTIRGSIGMVSGDFTVGERLEDSTLHAVLDAATFRTPMAKRDEHVQGKTLLDVARFPSMEFVSTEVARTTGGWEIRGLLTVHGEVAIDTAPIIVNEITLVGSRCGRFEPAMELLRLGSVKVRPMIAGRFPLSAAPEAFARASERGVLKVLMENCSGS